MNYSVVVWGFDNENAAEISFRRNVSSNVQRYKILKVKGERKCEE